MTLIFDIETNGLLVEKDGIPPMDKIHCIKIYDTERHQMTTYDPDNLSIDDAVYRLENVDTIVGHNIIGFDIPAIQLIYPDFIKPTGRIIDTYIWSACVFPNIKDMDYSLYKKGILPASLIGSYSLEAFGYRLGVYKGEFAKQTDWAEWTPEMSAYCEQDVVVTLRLLDLLKTKNTSWEQVNLEQEVKAILQRQEDHGVLFDVKSGERLYKELSAKREKLREDIQKSFPPFWRRKGRLFTPKQDNKRLGYIAGAANQKIELVEFNPSSSVHISRMLMQKYDWIPTEFADKEMAPVELMYQYKRLGVTSATIPKVDDEILQRLPYPEAKPLSEFQMLQKRCAMLAEGKQAWLSCYHEDTHRIHGSINQFGTVTGRCNHFKPNLGQVTAAHHPYGKECRSLFIVPDGYYLVGCDADGLEARCKAHYLAPYDDSQFIQTILEGNKDDGTDTHSLNQSYLKLASRNVAKTYYYAWLYGSGNANLGMIAMTDDNYKDYDGDPAKLGSKTRGMLIKNFTGVKALIDAVQTKVKLRHPNMWLKGLDGRRVPVRAVYSALNTLFQSAGAVIMKKAMVITHDLLCHEGLTPGTDYAQVLFVHDEYQFECRTKEIADIVAITVPEAIKLTGEYFKLRCPLSGSSKIGKNWYDTH